MQRLRAKFDGKVFVPMEPVDLPVGKVLEVEVREENEPAPGSAQAIIAALRSSPPIDPTIVDEWERAMKQGEQPPTTEGIFDDLA